MKARRLLSVVALALSVSQAAPAYAQAPALVTLETSERHVVFGRRVALTGTVDDPTAPGRTVDIVTEGGKVVASPTVRDDGSFGTRYLPRKRTVLYARWLTTQSDPVTVNVRPLLRAELEPAPLFGRARVVGEVRPVMAGQRAELRLVRNGSTVASRSIRLGSSSRFESSFRIRKPGRHRVAVKVDGDEHLATRDRTGTFAPVLPSLGSGSRGRYVKVLERRLLDLGYYLPGADRAYDQKTSDAVIAFNKVQRSGRVGSVGEATWRALARPVVPRPKVVRGYHIEVDQTRQVIFVVAKRKVRWILHTSTGAGGATRDGDFRVHGKLAGTSGGGLYYPSYFDGLRAIHGWSSVPTYPASHGCARVPMWSAQWIYSKSEVGTRILVYH